MTGWDLHLVSVNVGSEKPIQNAKSSGRSGIYKVPVDGPRRIMRHGLAGDEISDKKNHGGVDQAVYIYGVPDYDWWVGQLECHLPPGTFGDNLTVAGLQSAWAFIGDRMSVGSVVLEVTAPRIPCVTLAARMEDPSFVKRFRAAERPGLYCRVIREGEVRAGDEVVYEMHPGPTVGTLEAFRDAFDPDPNEKTIRRHLAAPIDIRSRAEYEQRLQALLAMREG